MSDLRLFLSHSIHGHVLFFLVDFILLPFVPCTVPVTLLIFSLLRLQVISMFHIILILISSFAFYGGVVRLDHVLRLSLYINRHVIDRLRANIFFFIVLWT